MNQPKKDQAALDHIEQLADEEHRLYAQDSLTDTDRLRLSRIQLELDQCWDLLRQRRALREFGEDPDEARVRPPEIVEKYTG